MALPPDPWGLALSETAHGYATDGRQLYTWCAWDTLFITPILDQVAEVRSSCPVTGRPVSLTVGPEGLRRVEPPETVVSFLSPQQPWADDVITTFCHGVAFLWRDGEQRADDSESCVERLSESCHHRRQAEIHDDQTGDQRDWETDREQILRRRCSAHDAEGQIHDQ